MFRIIIPETRALFTVQPHSLHDLFYREMFLHSCHMFTALRSRNCAKNIKVTTCKVSKYSSRLSRPYRTPRDLSFFTRVRTYKYWAPNRTKILTPVERTDCSRTLINILTNCISARSLFHEHLYNVIVPYLRILSVYLYNTHALLTKIKL